MKFEKKKLSLPRGTVVNEIISPEINVRFPIISDLDVTSYGSSAFNKPAKTSRCYANFDERSS